MNSEVIKGILLFVAGGGIGVVATGVYFKKKLDKLEDEFEERVNEEIEEARIGIEQSFQEREHNYELFEESNDEDSKDLDEKALTDISKKILDNASKAREKPDLMAFHRGIVENEHYISYSGKKNEEPVKNEVPDEELESLATAYDDIELISPQEFGDIPSYDQINLYYLRDRNLVDDEGNVIEDVHAAIGDDALNEFGVYEADAVFVRNNRQETDYAVFLRDETLANFSL